MAGVRTDRLGLPNSATSSSTVDFVRSVAPGLKIALAGNYHKELMPDVHDYCIIIRHRMPRPLLAQRLEKQMPTTFYVCCVPNRPNSFTHSPPAEASWLGWHAASESYTGFLRWAYNSWTRDPLHDTRYPRRNWAAGDCFLVYPGARSSIRFERLREGIQDFEKIRILRRELSEGSSPEAKARLARLEEVLNQFSWAIGRKGNCSKILKMGRDVLTEIAR